MPTYRFRFSLLRYDRSSVNSTRDIHCQIPLFDEGIPTFGGTNGIH